MKDMKDWKEVPHLFANGKFKLKESKFHPDKVYDIEGYNSTFKGGCFLYNDGCLINTKYCTLIARKIKDMADEEWIGLLMNDEDDNIQTKEDALDCLRVNGKFLISHYSSGKISFIDAIYLLSIGVYPFDQSHFGDTVIDKNKFS